MPKKNDTPEEEIFVDKEPKSPWDAKPLTLEGTARLIQLIGGMLGDAAQRAAVQELMEEVDGQTRSRWYAFVGVLGKEQLAELLSIVTGKPAKWVEKSYSLVDASHALGQFFQNEDLGQVLKNLRPTAPNLLNLSEAVGTDGSPEPSTDSSVSTEEA